MPTGIPHHLRHGERGSHPHHRGEGARTDRSEQKSILNGYRLQTIPYECCLQQEDSSLLQGDSNSNYAENRGRRKTTHTTAGKGKFLNDSINTK